jgi:hypothetical protein
MRALSVEYRRRTAFARCFYGYERWIAAAWFFLYILYCILSVRVVTSSSEWLRHRQMAIISHSEAFGRIAR